MVHHNSTNVGNAGNAGNRRREPGEIIFTGATGKVKWFNKVKHFGFIYPDTSDVNEGNDVFVHESQLRKAGFETLDEGVPVSFDLERLPNGRVSAVNIRLVENSETESK